jgi:hypothetical protein
MRKSVLTIGLGVVAVAVAVGAGIANASISPARTTTAAPAAVSVASTETVLDSTQKQRRANEPKDGKANVVSSWGPAQFEASSVAQRAVFDKYGQTSLVSALRKGSTDVYTIVLKAKNGKTVTVAVDYLAFKALSIS